MTRREPNEYAEIKIMLREMRPYLDAVNPHVPVMGKDVYLDLWTVYEVAELRKLSPDGWWRGLWDDMLGAPAWEIWGRIDGGDWEPLSEWMLDDIRRERWRGEAFKQGLGDANRTEAERDDRAAIAARMRRVRSLCVRKPRLGEAATHLVDHPPSYREEVALLILRMYDDREDIYPADLRSHLKNGRNRSGECRFCNLRDA